MPTIIQNPTYGIHRAIHTIFHVQHQKKKNLPHQAIMSATQRKFMEIPKFKGKDIFSWLFKVYEFFKFNNTPSHDMVSISSYYME